MGAAATGFIVAVLGFTLIRPPTVVAGVDRVSLVAATLTAELITSPIPLVAEGLALVTEVDDELLVELFADALAEGSISVDDNPLVEDGFGALSEGTIAELIGSLAEVDEALELVTAELVAVESVDEPSELPTEVDAVLLVES